MSFLSMPGNPSLRQTLALILLVVFLSGLQGCSGKAETAPTSPAPDTGQPGSGGDVEEQIRQAVQKAIDEEKETSLALIIYETQIDQIKISQDGKWATARLTPIDPQTQKPVPAETGLALVTQQDGEWRAILPSNPLWEIVIRQMPADLIQPEMKAEWLAMATLRPSAAPSAPLTGYKLPWAGGETMAMTQSVGHDRYTPSGSAHFAFDFAKPGYPSGMFDVHAARSGLVKWVVWSNENGNESKANYLVLEDTSTSPTTYQLYLHLAKDSIPAELRIAGAPVKQGQKIGVADDTGISSGNHLHFHVHTYPYSYWSTSIDITFSEVTINGGRPRISSDLPYCRSSDVCIATQSTYLSNNFMVPDNSPPTGRISIPLHASTISNNPSLVAGSAEDSISGIAKAQVYGRFGGAWYPIGPAFNSSPFSFNWDMCSDEVPDGPVALALDVQDKALNKNNRLDTLIHFTKNFTCPEPAPACMPSANQVSLFASEGFDGTCILLGVGSYPTPSYLGSLGDNNTVSMRVGSSVQATLFSENSYKGRAETFLADASNLAQKRIGARTLSSIMVQSRSVTPAKPVLIWPLANATFDKDATFSLTWQESGGGTQYQAQVLLNGGQVLLTPWLEQTNWHISGLAPGSYTWQVKARNNSTESGWSTAQTFNIQNSAPPSLPAVTAPFSDTMDVLGGNWTSSANWIMSDQANHTPGGVYGWKYDVNSSQGYDNGGPNAGYLTSPRIIIPAGDEYFLRFWYLYETESRESFWDIRQVQISANGGQFEDILQFTNDPPNYWLGSPAISLARYAGQTIQVRFYFATLDKIYNNYKGWHIDDFSISATPPNPCADSDANRPDQATPIAYNSSISAVICPQGDIDYYQFQAEAGEQFGAHTVAQVNGSPLDTVLTLLDSDGRSVLAENDDQMLYQRSDSFITYRFTRSGTYYLSVRAWDHPSTGGAQYNYTIHLDHETDDPVAYFTYPQDHQTIKNEPVNLMVNASDPTSGISRVIFYWHPAEWESSDWILIGEDWNGSDGWNYPLDVSKIPGPSGMAVYAMAYDWSGNSIGTGAWNLSLPGLYLPLIFR